MISLDPAEWRTLRHAYGPADDIPPLLRRLAADPSPTKGHQDEPWFSLWSALCHQGDVYPASFAAVPHIVQVGLTAPGALDFNFFLLPACIEVARATGRGPALDDRAAAPYFAALRQLHDCAFAHAGDTWSDDMTLSVAAALAAAKGHVALAQALINLDDDTIREINVSNG